MRLNDDLKYFESREFKDILEKYESALEAGSALYMDADELTDVAEYYTMVVHDMDKAYRAIDIALDLHPDAVDPRIFLARQMMLQDELEKAYAMCDDVPDQQHREVLFLRAELMVRENKQKQAADYLMEQAQHIHEDKDYFFYDSAYIFVDYHDMDDAYTFALKLQEMAPDWFKTWELLSEVLLERNAFDEALGYIEQMLDKDPFYIDAWHWRTEAYCGLADYPKAIEGTDYALAIDPDNERALELRAWTFMRQENCKEAHRLYERLRRMNPESEIHCLYDSYCVFDMGQTDDALKLIEESERLADGCSPEQAAIYEHHAHILSEKGQIEAALQYIQRAEQQAAVSDGLQDNIQDFDYYRARIYADNGNSDEALKYIEKIGKKGIEPIASVIYQGAQILFEAGDYSLALQMFEQLIQQADQDFAIPLYPYLAACYHEVGDTNRCLQYLRLAVDNNSPEMKELLGYLFAEGVQPIEYYDYYYYKIYGCWPDPPSVAF
ncbi:MAG: tetratricopeptide repeat protein [Bacteroidaceae bacterium]|nr:tetratricopeptide repeat protein [Bacteroidaceae bacterium]